MTEPTRLPASKERKAAARLRKRRSAERRFHLYATLAIGLAVGILALLIGSIVAKGWSAFVQTNLRIEVYFDPALIDPEGERRTQALTSADYAPILRQALQTRFPEASGRREIRDLLGLISSGARFQLRDMVLQNPDLIGERRLVWLRASDDSDMLAKGYMPRTASESERRLNDRQIAWLDALRDEGNLARQPNWLFFTGADSREPEQAGIWGATVGSFFTLVITLALAFPVGLAAAIYLEEFAPRSRWVDLVEVNINNLAAVPSIVFGLLGLAVFLNVLHLPRSAPLVGGLTLALMTLPTIIITTRAALQSVPPSIREAAIGLGASPVQVVFHHVVPLALPGIMTGTIIGMARALGETAPLLMIGMVAFIVDVPGGPLDPASALPVQIFLWADSPERAFVEKTSAATLVLLVFLVAMNGLAIYLRKKFERRW